MEVTHCEGKESEAEAGIFAISVVLTTKVEITSEKVLGIPSGVVGVRVISEKISRY